MQSCHKNTNVSQLCKLMKTRNCDTFMGLSTSIPANIHANANASINTLADCRHRPLY